MADNDIQNEIRALEERLLQPDVRNSAEELDRLLADEFVEFGSSGRVFDKAAIIRSMAGASGDFRYSLEDFRVTLLGPTIALAIYCLVGQVSSNEPRQTLRSSVWICRGGAWRLAFHQGTVTTAATRATV